MSASGEGAGRGRPPKGSGLVEGLEGSEHARERLRLILDTMAGKIAVEEACRKLDIGEARFHEMRCEVLQAAIGRLEPGRAGRPPKRTGEESSEVAALKKEIDDLKFDLQASRLREEIAVAMPNVLRRKATAGPLKKTETLEA